MHNLILSYIINYRVKESGEVGLLCFDIIYSLSDPMHSLSFYCVKKA